MDRTDGVFVSRIALESAVYSSGCIVVGDEILAVNLVDVTRMSLDDVVIIMSIPRRLVLTTRRKKAAPPRFPGANGGPGSARTLDHKPAPVVVFKGDPDLSHNSAEFAFRSEIQPPQPGPGLNGGRGPGPGHERPFGSPGRRDQAPFRDSRTLTWDRNPKPDRNDPKYFPVNSLPRQRVPNTTLSPPRDEWGPGGQAGGGPGAGDSYLGPGGSHYDNRDMPPPMHALPSYQPPPPVVTEQPRLSKVRVLDQTNYDYLLVQCDYFQEPTHFKPYKHPYSAGLNGKAGGGTLPDGGKHGHMAHNYSDSDFYSPPNYNNDQGEALVMSRTTGSLIPIHSVL